MGKCNSINEAEKSTTTGFFSNASLDEYFHFHSVFLYLVLFLLYINMIYIVLNSPVRHDYM